MIESARHDVVRGQTFARSKRRNALTPDGLEALVASRAAASEPVLCLQGRVTSCAGTDLDTVDAPDDADDVAALGQDVTRKKVTDDGATVVAIDGTTRGGGLEALAADVCVCSPASTFAATSVSIGLFGAWGGMTRLPAFLGTGAAADLALSGP